MKISFQDTQSTSSKAETLVFLVGDDKKFSTALAALDKKSGGAIARSLAASKFTGKKGQFFGIPGIPGYDRIVLAGAGKLAELSALIAQSIGGGAVPTLNAYGAKTATFVVDLPKAALSNTDLAAHIGYGALLKSYRFDKYHTKQKPEDKPTLAGLNFVVAQSKTAQAAFGQLEPLAQGIFVTRNLVTEPPNVIYPESLANECKKLTKLGVDVKILGEAEMTKLGMGSLLGVGQGSVRESKLIVMQWNGAKAAKGKAAAPLAFVGKGVCFDTGGISIKPAGGMEDMKYDMAGAGAVIGLMHALAARKAKVNVVCVAGAVENMPDGNAIRPSDVLTSMSGQTIEVLNTDAEGRLVLADALWYAQVNFSPRLIVDLATLTGAIVVALGTSRAGLFSNDDTLAQQLFDAGKASGEELWRLPLADVYDKQINSDIADMQNIGADREAGSITAAQFLQRFIKEGTPWAHLDIAGMAWSKKGSDTNPKGATGYGIRLLDRFIKDNYEGK